MHDALIELALLAFFFRPRFDRHCKMASVDDINWDAEDLLGSDSEKVAKHPEGSLLQKTMDDIDNLIGGPGSGGHGNPADQQEESHGLGDFSSIWNAA